MASVADLPTLAPPTRRETTLRVNKATLTQDRRNLRMRLCAVALTAPHHRRNGDVHDPRGHHHAGHLLSHEVAGTSQGNTEGVGDAELLPTQEHASLKMVVGRLED
jgi:hypothetical protein